MQTWAKPKSKSDSVLRRATLAQLVEQCFRKAEVPSSILGSGSISLEFKLQIW